MNAETIQFIKKNDGQFCFGNVTFKLQIRIKSSLYNFSYHNINALFVSLIYFLPCFAHHHRHSHHIEIERKRNKYEKKLSRW